MTDAQKPHAGLGPVDHTVGRPGAERAERRKCDDCGHSGDEGGSTTESYCGVCGSTVPYPKEDQCQECGATNCMLIACPECGGRYWEQDECSEPPNVAGNRLAPTQEQR